MNELDKEEAAQIAQVENAAKRAVQTIRDYFAMKRGFLGGNSFSENEGSQKSAGKATANRPVSATTRTRELVALVLAEIDVYPNDPYTFPAIKDSLAQKGHELTRDEMRRVMSHIVGKAPAFEVSPRHGSVAGLYSKIPVAGSRAELDLPEFTISKNGHASSREEAR